MSLRQAYPDLHQLLGGHQPLEMMTYLPYPAWHHLFPSASTTFRHRTLARLLRTSSMTIYRVVKEARQLLEQRGHSVEHRQPQRNDQKSVLIPSKS